MIKENLEIPEKQQNQFSDIEVIKYLIEQKKAEFQAIQGKITQYKTQVSVLEQRLVNLEADHRAKLLAERQAFERERQQKLNDITNRIDALQKGEVDYTHRKIELEEKELRNQQIVEERKVLFDEKLKYENLNNQAQLKLNEANKLYEDAIKKLDETSKKEQEANTKFTEVKNIQSINEKTREDLTIKENDIKKQTENLVALREEINPKIEELNKLTMENNRKIAEIKQKEQEINDKIAEDNKLMDAITEREKFQKKKELDIAIKEQELLRKEIVIKNL